MDYVTLQDLIDRFGEGELGGIVGTHLADPEDPESEEILNTVSLALGITSAEAEVNAALKGRYSLDGDVVPALLKQIAMDLAMGYLPRNAMDDSDIINSNAKRARRQLADIRDGKLDPDLPRAAAPSGSSAGGVQSYSEPGPYDGMGSNWP